MSSLHCCATATDAVTHPLTHSHSRSLTLTLTLTLYPPSPSVGVGSIIALVVIFLLVGATMGRAGFEGIMETTPSSEFNLLRMNLDNGFEAFLTMFCLMTTGENIYDLVYGVTDEAHVFLREYLAPLLFFPLCMLGTYLLAGLMIAGFQDEFMARFLDTLDKRERRFDSVCAYAYALLDTNQSGSLGREEFRTFIKSSMVSE
jgi:hypothetical protein